MNDKFLMICVFVLLLGGYLKASDSEKILSRGKVLIDNGSVWKDTDGNEILAQGGCIFQSGKIFHWFGPQFGNAGDYKFHAINHYISEDLRNWKKQSAAFTPGMAGIPFQSGNWVGRPWIVYNAVTSKFVMIIEWGGGHREGIRNQYAFLVSSSLAGPWSYVNLIQKLPDLDGIRYSLGDLGAFQDGENAYLVYTFDKGKTNRTQAIIKLDPLNFTSALSPSPETYSEFTGEVREAASVVKRGSVYYYFTSRCSGWKSSETKYRTAPKMNGPWSDAKLLGTQPYSTNSYDTQHDFVLPVKGSKETLYIYFGDRWSNYTTTGVGRYQWFPMIFDQNGVPSILAPGYSTNGGDWYFNSKTGEYVIP